MAKFERMSRPDDPERCQSLGGQGQCPFKGVLLEDGTRGKHCPRHNPNFAAQKKQQTEAKGLYFAAMWKDQIKDQATHVNVKSLREEIGVLRIMVDSNLKRCSDENELMMRGSTISELITKIQVLVLSCHKVEKDLGVLLDKNQAVRLATEMVEIVSRYVDDADIMDALKDDLLNAVDKIATEGPTI